MKIAIYTIALNEAKHADRWADCALDADLALVADTGSTDGTQSLLKQRGVTVHEIAVTPWRFDDARNAALSLIPKDFDYCIVLDLDEVLDPGWRHEVERCHAQGATRLRYKYVWSHTPSGGDGLSFYRDGLHQRHGYRWVHPVHEVLKPDRIDEKLVESFITVHHWPDNDKSRGQYLELLYQSVKEAPEDDRNAYYYARELFYKGFNDAAIYEFKRHLSLKSAVWAPERAASMRHLAKLEPGNKEYWLEKAIVESPGRREPLVELAQHYYEIQAWEHCRRCAEKALSVKDRPLDYLCEDFAWGSIPYDLAAMACYYLGDFKMAMAHGLSAVNLDPLNERLKINNQFYIKSLEDKANGRV